MELFISLRYLRGKRKIGFISIISYISIVGIFLGSSILIVALSIANGSEKEIQDRFIGIYAHGKIMQYHSNAIENHDSLCTIIQKNPEITATAPFILEKGILEYRSVKEGVIINGIDVDRDSAVTNISRNILEGTYNLDSSISKRGRMHPGIIVGKGFALKTGVTVGSEITAITLMDNSGELEPIPIMRRFVVNGIFETGMPEFDYNLVYISVEQAQSLFGIRGVHGINVKTTDVFKSASIMAEINNQLGGYPYRTIDWQEQNKTLFKWMKLERLIIFIILTCIMLVASFNIFSSLLMTILEKRQEIGILMSMGTEQNSIIKIFVYTGLVIGLIGSLCGVSFGFLICTLQSTWKIITIPSDIYWISWLPVHVLPFDVLAVFITANVICLCATIFPAIQASKILPAEALRYN